MKTSRFPQISLGISLTILCVIVFTNFIPGAIRYVQSPSNGTVYKLLTDQYLQQVDLYGNPIPGARCQILPGKFVTVLDNSYFTPQYPSDDTPYDRALLEYDPVIAPVADECPRSFRYSESTYVLPMEGYYEPL